MAWIEKRNGKWHIAWREGKRIRRRVGYTDKLATKMLLAKLEKAQARGEQDAIDKFDPHKRTPIGDVIGEYTADLAANGRDPHYRYVCGRRLNKLATFAGWERLGDFSADGLRRFKAAHADTLSAKTLHQYAATLHGFGEWCATHGRLASNPIGPVKATATEARRRRRALTQDELHRLFKAAPPDRRIVYLVAVGTGLRRTELADLVWGDVRLDSPTPFIKLRAIATKARRADTIAIKAEAAAALRGHRPADADLADPVFPRVPTLARFIRDLDQAGIDHGFTFDKAEGRWHRTAGRVQVDFHSLRKTLNTLLQLADTPAAVGMKQMRLTDRRLYDDTYSDKAVFDTAAALAKLPDLRPADGDHAGAAALPATGTTGGADVRDQFRVANRVARATLKGLEASNCVPTCTTGEGSKIGEKPSKTADLAASGPTCLSPDGTPQVGFEPTTRRLTAGCSTIELLRNVLRCPPGRAWKCILRPGRVKATGAQVPPPIGFYGR